MVEITGYRTIRTVDGDTFDSLALEFYDDEKQTKLLYDANPDYCDVLIFPADVTLQVPIVEGSDLPETLPPWRRDSA